MLPAVETVNAADMLTVVEEKLVGSLAAGLDLHYHESFGTLNTAAVAVDMKFVVADLLAVDVAAVVVVDIFVEADTVAAQDSETEETALLAAAAQVAELIDFGNG